MGESVVKPGLHLVWKKTVRNVEFNRNGTVLNDQLKNVIMVAQMADTVSSFVISDGQTIIDQATPHHTNQAGANVPQIKCVVQYKPSRNKANVEANWTHPSSQHLVGNNPGIGHDILRMLIWGCLEI